MSANTASSPLFVFGMTDAGTFASPFRCLLQSVVRIRHDPVLVIVECPQALHVPFYAEIALLSLGLI